MYGDLIRLDPDGGSPDGALTRIPLDTSAAGGGMDERSLRDLLFRFPETLPIAAIDATYQGAIPVCRELWTPAVEPRRVRPEWDDLPPPPGRHECR